MSRGPAYRIETERLVIRSWEPKDASLLHAAIEESLDHLKPWMPWAHDEPKTIEQRVELLRTFRGKFDLGEDFVYGIFDSDETAVLGGTGLHTRRGKKMREIGYWIHVDHVRRGLATESAAALVKVAFEIDGVSRVEIRCDPENKASSAIPQKLGFTFEGVRRKDSDFLGSMRDSEVWSLLAEEYPASPSTTAAIRAFDVLGESLIGLFGNFLSPRPSSD